MVKTKARILLVDDHPVLRRGLAGLIEHEPDLVVCGEAEGVGEALRVLKSSRPDVVVVDMTLKDGHGLDLIKSIRAMPKPPKVLVVSMHEEASYAERALRAGAQGYVPKSEAVDIIVDAIRQVLRGEVYLKPAIAERLLHGMVGGAKLRGSPEELLSDRELQVFELLGKGLSTREISLQLKLSIKTIDAYREHIKTKLSLPTANELILHAVLWEHAER